MHADSPAGRSGVTSFEHITSPANAVVKLLKSLDRKKGRAESGLFLAEGARLAGEGLAHGWTPAYVLAGQAALERPGTRDLLARLSAAGARTLTAAPKVLESVARKDNPQNVIAAFHQKLSSLSDFPVDGPRRWMALYEVRDPGNLGTVIRTADAAGVSGVILLNKCCDPFSVEAVRATMGSLFAMKLAAADFEEFDAWRKSAGATLVAASMRGKMRHDAADYGQRSVIMMGNEQAGLPPTVEDCCDTLVRIPMAGAADSLNLASAASVMIYEAWRAANYAGAAR